MCTDFETTKLNALLKATTEKKGLLTVCYGPYMNWGRLNRNTKRIAVLVKELQAIGYDVQLKFLSEAVHYVSISKYGDVIWEHASIQENKMYPFRNQEYAKAVLMVKTA